MSKMAFNYRIKVFFDLETTGLDTSQCEIIQLSAVCGERVLDKYSLPSGIITKGAQRITGLTVCDGKLFLRGDQVPTVPLSDLLTSFIAFLKSLPQPVLLVAHNAKRFDVPVLMSALRECSLLHEFKKVVHGFLDTYLLSRNLYPGLNSHSLPNLADYFLAGSYMAHNAVEDARILQKMFRSWSPDSMAIEKDTYSFEDF